MTQSKTPESCNLLIKDLSKISLTYINTLPLTYENDVPEISGEKVEVIESHYDKEFVDSNDLYNYGPKR